MDSRRQIAITIAVVALVAVAGCTSSISGDSPATNGTATNATDAGTTTATLDDVSFPDGANDERVENGSALADAHAAAISDQGYAVELATTYSSEQESGSSTFVIRHDADSDELYRRTVRTSDGNEQRMFGYANESGTYSKRGTANAEYNVQTTSTVEEVAEDNQIATAPSLLLTAGDWTSPSVVSTDGETFIEYELDDVRKDADLVRPETVTNASGSVLVDQQGVVHSFTMNLTQERDGVESQTQFEYHVTKLGDVAVEKPAWVSTAVEQAGSDDDTTVSSRVQVVSSFGSVSDGRVETVNLTVMRGPGADDINLSMATVEWVGPSAATTLTAGDSMTGETFVVEPIKDDDDSAPVLNEQNDRFTIAMDATEVGSALEEGDAVELKVTTQYGAVTYYRANVPEDLSDETAVTL